MTDKFKTMVGVIGASSPSVEGLDVAEAIGREIANRGAVVVCGGLGGVMEAASKGAVEAGGEVMGILPGPDKSSANSYITLPVSTNMGHARNIVIAHTADVLIAVEGEYGTVSEAAIGLKLGKRVVALQGGIELSGVVHAKTPAEAVSMAFEGLLK